VSNESSPAARVLRLPIVAGLMTCAVSKGVFCRFLSIPLLGSETAICRLFGEALHDTNGDGTGSILRGGELELVARATIGLVNTL
jgi:hypothetical protein